MATDFKVVDLNEFITDIMHFFKRIVEETIEIRLDLSPDVLHVRCDPSQFTQVMMHLILNARDAMPGGGIITIKTERRLASNVHVPDGRAEESPERYCCITISDTSTGMDEQHLQRIFDPCATTNDIGKDTGLGLTIVYSLIRSHNGTVAVSSKKGEGTRITICMPLCDLQRESDEVPFYEKIPARESERISGSETILVVEDEDELRDMLTSFMSSLGYTVVPAHNGHEALLLYRTDPKKFHLVISDMLMPQTGGIELFHEIRKLDQHARFILVTGYSLAGVDEQVLAQMTAILKKPYTPKQVVKLMRDIIDA
jgi:CheY-like chemotaxis protein